MLAIAALLAGRVRFGVGELYRHRRHPVGIKTVGAITRHGLSPRNGVATYVAMAVGAPLGVTLNHYFGISGFATVVVLVAAIGLLFARTRRRQGDRRHQSALSRGGAKIWPYGSGWPLAPSVSALSPPLSPLLRRAQLAGRRVYPFAVQRRLYLRSLGAGKYHYPLWRSPGLPRLLHHRKSRPASYLAGAISMDGRRRRLSHRFGFLAWSFRL